jgi:hypothetical protein
MTAAPGPDLANPASFPRILAKLSHHVANFPSQLLASYTSTFTSWSSIILGRITMTRYNGLLHTLPEAFPLPDITAETVSCTLLSDWISCFGRLHIIMTNQESKFESQLFHNLAKVCGIHLCWTNPTILPMLIGYIARLKLPLCYADEQWTEAITLVLLVIHTAYKEDLSDQPRQHTIHSPQRPTQAARHSFTTTFIHRDLKDLVHIFVWQDAIPRSLEPPFMAHTKSLPTMT